MYHILGPEDPSGHPPEPSPHGQAPTETRAPAAKKPLLGPFRVHPCFFGLGTLFTLILKKRRGAPPLRGVGGAREATLAHVEPNDAHLPGLQRAWNQPLPPTLNGPGLAGSCSASTGGVAPRQAGRAAGRRAARTSRDPRSQTTQDWRGCRGPGRPLVHPSTRLTLCPAGHKTRLALTVSRPPDPAAVPGGSKGSLDPAHLVPGPARRPA